MLYILLKNKQTSSTSDALIHVFLSSIDHIIDSTKAVNTGSFVIGTQYGAKGVESAQGQLAARAAHP